MGDTLGVGSPFNVRSLIAYVSDNGVPLDRLAGHFHDTYGQAVANVWEAYRCGMRTFDSSIAGLGGCPFAPGAKGNVATEDLVYMFRSAGIDTGANLEKLVDIGSWVSQQLTQPNASRVGTAMAAAKQSTATANPHENKSTTPPAIQWNLVSEKEGVLLYRSGVNLKIALNRPKNGNALTAAVISNMTAALDNAGKDPSISRIVITANGKLFCTGMDLGQDSTSVGQGGSASDAQFERLSQLFCAIDQSPKLTIACLNGPAFGGGVGLAFACDIRLCAKNATVTLSEVKLGLCPATISAYVVREWGVAFAREAMVTARPVSAAELRARGLVTEVADDQEHLQDRLGHLLTRLKVASPNATRMSKELTRLGWANGGRSEQAAGIKHLFKQMMRPDADGAFGVKEFQHGRKVDWDMYTERQARSKL